MPIVDVEVVSAELELSSSPSVAALASALGRVFASPPGHTWVRFRVLPAICYAENDSPLTAEALPVFVTILQAQPPEGVALRAQVGAITETVATWLSVPHLQVHVSYAPAAAARQAFGGKLV